MGIKFGMEEGTEAPLRAKFHPHRCNVSPLRGEKLQNWPLSKLNTGRFAPRAMLPVKMPFEYYEFIANPRQISLAHSECINLALECSWNKEGIFRMLS